MNAHLDSFVVVNTIGPTRINTRDHLPGSSGECLSAFGELGRVPEDSLI